ncbi:SDR family NAD(P)-dependent oxidoreductase [Pinisolibacter aquiterrae]|uniref:SDR family NAD(P)-dependent oxidoreductase n=1 Tax=Pinisolibacter aquiterrae TaxID=2815579 RepID=UPI001C3D62F7|nr:SDR family NAD(P)-dependent oxidoreductase [Pinisolibacter aquiterrae]MBV5266045.1 SDR family NAD(P)-dependent oxidoreductase [Pinisolibacter aquiterrae]MCC8233509.1 SDR family NAD(P)-dependent oxidoreductase [Pinisolibacter aquiterrae]
MPREIERVLVTGGGTGIGRALVLEAARRGMRVALCGRRRAPLEETVAALPEGAAPLLIEADITVASDRARVVARIADAWGALDVLVNNAGVVMGGAADGLGDDALEDLFRTNVLAPMALTRDLAPLLAAARPSRVVNVGSMFGDIAYPGFAAYSASKFALRGFSDALRREWKPIGIGVTYVAPRATRTAAATAFQDLIAASGMSLDDPGRVAAAIWRAVERGRDDAYPLGLERLFVLVQRLAPKLIDRALTRSAVRGAN